MCRHSGKIRRPVDLLYPYDEEYGEDQVPVGIDISDSILMTKYNLYPDSCALGIGAYSEHLDAVEQFLDYIFEED
jgi:hypothetical protein